MEVLLLLLVVGWMIGFFSREMLMAATKLLEQIKTLQQRQPK